MTPPEPPAVGWSRPEQAVYLPPVGPLDVAWSVVLWALGIAWIAIGTGPMIVSAFLGRRIHDPVGWLYSRVQVALTLSRYRVHLHPDIDPKATYVFAQCHYNLLDHVLLYPGVPHFLQGLELESHFKIPLYGWFMKARGTIGVRPGKSGQTPEIMQKMRDELARGGSILAFPEGHRSMDGRVRPFRKGVFFIARDLGIPVVPVAAPGWFEVQNKTSWLLRPFRRVDVHCLAPIETAGVPDEGIEALAHRAWTAVADVTDAHWAAVEAERRERGILVPPWRPEERG